MLYNLWRYGGALAPLLLAALILYESCEYSLWTVLDLAICGLYLAFHFVVVAITKSR